MKGGTVMDTYSDGQCLPDQTANGTILTFTFSEMMDLIWVYSSTQIARADPNGSNPGSNIGVFCPIATPTPITRRTNTLLVSCASGTISVWGYAY